MARNTATAIPADSIQSELRNRKMTFMARATMRILMIGSPKLLKYCRKKPFLLRFVRVFAPWSRREASTCSSVSPTPIPSAAPPRGKFCSFMKTAPCVLFDYFYARPSRFMSFSRNLFSFAAPRGAEKRANYVRPSKFAFPRPRQSPFFLVRTSPTINSPSPHKNDVSQVTKMIFALR